jgi:phenylpropionate dioxygenase-like ring-hydroxylating dioxygenase large terminal subunit
MAYPRLQWYVAATSGEISRTLLERRILDEPVVFYRTESGLPVALAGLCPHRLYPLAQGRLTGDAIICGYHGITFNSSGRCVHIPSQGKIPDRMSVRGYPVQEVGGMVWIWMGPPGSGAPGPLPDISRAGIAAPGFRHDFNPLFRLPARYQLLIDNLMDLSHLSFVHAATVPDGAHVAGVEPQISESQGVLSVIRKFGQVPAAGFIQFLHPDIVGDVENTLTSDYFGPSFINAGGPWIRKPGESVERQMNFFHAMTPETPHSTHYFNGVSRNFSLDNEGLSQMLLGQSAAVIAEDIRALEILEAHMQAGGSNLKEISVVGDAGALRVRRNIGAPIQAEQGDTPVAEQAKRPAPARI